MANDTVSDTNLKERAGKYLIIVSAIAVILGTLIGFLLKWMNGLSFKCTVPGLCKVEGPMLVEP